MGLCKCPKRQITNQFCFEHRVNVCEHCMITSHPKCIVQSYLQWLKDSDYVSSCTLCGSSLEEGDCVRLVCYHVFHWACLNARQSALPANTAPGGHTCPICAYPIFPSNNLISPVAEVLKGRLSQVNWGRNELGLPLLSDEKVDQARSSSPPHWPNRGYREKKKREPNGDFVNNNAKSPSPHSVLLMDSFNPPSSDLHDLHAGSRRPPLPRQAPIGGTDRDENKYKRTPAEIFSRWSRRFYAPSSRPPWRRTWFVVLMGFLLFVFIIYLMATFGRGSVSNDSFWENNHPDLSRDG